MPSRKVKLITSSEVLDQLRQFIESCNLQPGERLPSERTLAQQFRVGRPPVQEAVKAMRTLLLTVRLNLIAQADAGRESDRRKGNPSARISFPQRR